MPDALTLPPRTPAASPVGDPAPDVCVWEHVARAVAWLDQATGRSPHDIATRVMKIGEEAGKALAAYLIMTGTNPRKPPHPGAADEFTGELCDVVLAALVALATVTGGTPQAEAALARHVAARSGRLTALRAAA